MTLETLKNFNPISDIFTALLPLNLDDFVTSFQTFAPTISADILSASLDSGCNCVNRIILYTELYKNESCQFLYDYATQKDLGEIIDQVIINSANVQIDLIGRIAKTSVDSWSEFATKINKLHYNHFAVSLSGNDIFVYFL
jgi:hypothetical protein